MSLFIDDSYALTQRIQPILVGQSKAACIAALLALACTLIESRESMDEAPNEVVLLLASSREVIAALGYAHAHTTMRES